MNSNENSKARILVSGLVQGVFFRAFVREHALKLGLKGSVRNLPSGNKVEVIASGKKEKIQSLIKLLKKGSASSIVELIEVEWLPFKKNEFKDFKINYSII